MAEILETYEFKQGTRGRPQYPYDEWFDGKIRKLYQSSNRPHLSDDKYRQPTKGDFDCSVDSMRGQLYQTAKRRNIEIRTTCGPDYIIIQRREE